MAAWYQLADVFLSRLDAEAAHGLALRALKTGLLPADRRPDAPSLTVKVWGRTLPNPIGLAAGFDKNAEAPDALLDIGYEKDITFESFSSAVVDESLSLACAIWRDTWTDNMPLARHAKSFIDLKMDEAKRRRATNARP